MAWSIVRWMTTGITMRPTATARPMTMVDTKPVRSSGLCSIPRLKRAHAPMRGASVTSGSVAMSTSAIFGLGFFVRRGQRKIVGVLQQLFVGSASGDGSILHEDHPISQPDGRQSMSHDQHRRRIVAFA